MSGPKSLDEVDPELLKVYEKLGIPLKEQAILAGVQQQPEVPKEQLYDEDGNPVADRRIAVDAVFDSVSVVTTFKEELAKSGVIFCPISEAVHTHPELVQKYLGSVVPTTDNYYATLNSAVFSDGSFVYIPPGVKCPMELSTYFRINEQNTGQFERTLIIRRQGRLCVLSRRLHGAEARREPASRRCGRTRHARRCRDQIFDRAELVSGRCRRQGRHLQLRDEAWRLPRQ